MWKKKVSDIKDGNISSVSDGRVKNFNIKQIFSTALRLTCIVAGVVLVLSVVNSLTADVIAENERRTGEAARKELMPDAVSFEKMDIKLEENEKAIDEIYRADGGNSVLGYCVSIDAQGFSSDGISLIVGISSENSVTGVIAVTNAETPGIGAKVLESNGEYLLKYSNVSVMSVAEIDSVSGATVTSGAVKKAVETALNTVSRMTAK